MFTNLYIVDLKGSSWLLKERSMYVISKEGVRSGIAFYQGQRNRFDLQLAVSE